MPSLCWGQPALGVLGMGPFSILLCNDTVSDSLLVSFLFERSIGNAYEEDTIVNSVLKLKLLNVKCKKKIAFGFNFWKCDRKPVRSYRRLLKHIRISHSNFFKKLLIFTLQSFTDKTSEIRHLILGKNQSSSRCLECQTKDNGSPPACKEHH